MANLTLEQIEEIAGRPYHMCVLTSPEERDALCEMAREAIGCRSSGCADYYKAALADLAKLRAVRDAAKHFVARECIGRGTRDDFVAVEHAFTALAATLAAAEDLK